jgi:hypothetical protein
MKKKGFIFLALFLSLFLLSFPILLAEEINNQDDNKIPTEENVSNPKIPEELQKVFKIIFKLKKIEFKEIVMMSALFLLVTIILQQALSIELKNKLISWLIAISIILIASSSGAMHYVTRFWKMLGEFARIPEKFGVFWTSLGIIILVIAYILIKYLKSSAKEANKIVDAEKQGFLEGLKEVKDKIRAKFN